MIQISLLMDVSQLKKYRRREDVDKTISSGKYLFVIFKLLGNLFKSVRNSETMFTNVLEVQEDL